MNFSMGFYPLKNNRKVGQIREMSSYFSTSKLNLYDLKFKSVIKFYFTYYYNIYKKL